jgi:protein transport protein SEC24
MVRHTSVDEGNSIPRLFRCSVQRLLADGNTYQDTVAFPLGCVVQPFADLGEHEAPVPRSVHGGEELLRCTRCGAYVNPGFSFLEVGAKFVCNLCKLTSAVGYDYFSKGGNTSGDATEHFELTRGTYDFLAPSRFVGKKVAHNLLFVVECTQNSINFGMAQQVVSSLKATLDLLPDPEHTNVGIITFTNVVQVYVPSGTETGDPTVVMMSDVESPFAPLPRTRLLLNVLKSRPQLDNILAKVAGMCEGLGKTRTPSCAGAALKTAIDVLSGEAGKVLWFIMDAPSVGVGVLKCRNQTQFHNTDKEITLVTPAPTPTLYQDLVRTCLVHSLAVDIFVCAQSELDLASLMPVSSGVGGEVYYYPLFNAAE